MRVLQQTREAEIIILAVGASNHLRLIEFCDTISKTHLSTGAAGPLTSEASIAGALAHLFGRVRRGRHRLGSRDRFRTRDCFRSRDRLGSRNGHHLAGLLLGRFWLSLGPPRSDRFGRAVGHDAIGDHAFDQPVILTVASDTRIYTSWAEIVVPVVTDAAVVVFPRDGAPTVVAVDAERRGGGVGRREEQRIGRLILTKRKKTVARLNRRGLDGRDLLDRLHSLRRRIHGGTNHGQDAVGPNGRWQGRAQDGFQVAVTLGWLVLNWSILGNRRCGNFGHCGRRGVDGRLDTKLQFGLGRAVELFVDGRIVTVEVNVTGSAV